jgi:hypothetical protein
MFQQRTNPQIVLKLISIKAEQLQKTGYGKRMPYVGQGLLEFTIQALKNWMEEPISVSEACQKAIADDRKLHKQLKQPFRLPPNYCQILEEILSMVAWLCRPASGFVREEDRQEMLKLIAALQAKV